MPPGTRALAFASRWFDDVTVHRTFEPLIADWQRQWQDAPPARRRGFNIRAWLAFVCAVLISSPEIVRAPVPSTVRRRVVTRIALFVAVSSGVLMLGSLSSFSWDGPPRPFFVLLLPATITVAFPFAMALAVDAIRQQNAMPLQVARAAALKLALLSIVFMIAFGGWVVPTANQMWREKSVKSGMLRSAYPHAVANRGVRELTTAELMFEPSPAMAHEPFSGNADRETRAQRELNNRAVLTVLPLLLIWLRWRAGDLPRRRWIRPLPALVSTGFSTAAFCGLYFLGWRTEFEWKLSAGVGFWLPIALIALWGITAPYLRRQLVALA